MLMTNFLAPIWSQAILVRQTVETTPIYDKGLLYLTMIGASLLLSFQNAAMTISMKYNTLGIVAILLYLAIPFGYLLDFLFLKR